MTITFEPNRDVTKRILKAVEDSVAINTPEDAVNYLIELLIVKESHEEKIWR